LNTIKINPETNSSFTSAVVPLFFLCPTSGLNPGQSAANESLARPHWVPLLAA
jgi:hypothetical protein